MGVGAVSAFPVITESLMEKLPPADRMILETNMKELVLHNAFTDCALKDTTVTEKFSIAPGKSFYEYFLNSGERKNEVHSTWKAEINPGLFPHETRTKKETEYEVKWLIPDIPSREWLYERINKRVDIMFENGIIEETEIP